MSKMKKYFSTYHNVKMPWVLLILGLILGGISNFLEVRTVTLTAGIIDSSQSAIKLSQLIKYISYILYTGTLSIASTYVCARAYQEINYGVRNKLWDKIMHIPMKYYDSESGESLVSRVAVDASGASDVFDVAIGAILSVLSCVIAYRDMFSSNKEISLYLLLLLPFSALISALLGAFAFHTGYRIKNTYATTTGYLIEHIHNLHLIKASTMEENEMINGNDKFQKQYKADIQNGIVSILQTLSVILLSILSVSLIFVIGSRKVATGDMTVGQIIAMYTLAGMCNVRISQIIIYYSRFTEACGGIKKVAEVLAAPSEQEDGGVVENEARDIVFRNVTFAYKNEKNVLNGLNVIIPKNKCTAIIGENGCGKSTIIKLIERVYEPAGGEILFGETSLSMYNLYDWRNKFSIVMQGKSLVPGTIKDNLLYGTTRKVSQEEIDYAAKMANIYDLIMTLPKKYDTEISNDGDNFSGGQCQCIAIARAILNNTDYLLLDEATSNLDAKTEHDVVTALDNLMANKTTIMVAHSSFAIKNADYIVAIENGMLESAGTKAEMLKNSKVYKEFMDSQV